ncbi:MAG: SDR family NAD(P)-dependent oxidoreductase [Planctomycetes bacterium]|nr:SDR family NAD(P)-dependent oxidoreductase [Planctomycetota bacterium]MCB9916702.1 SDR family NAD(P)-dependent oxidoreductase [Planctomycetota bacterium]
MTDASLPLAGRHALVTGAGRGIGRAVALALAARGAALTLVARNARALAAVADEARAAGASSVGCEAVDLLDRDDLAELCETVAVSADVLVNNAGTAPSAPLEKTHDDLFDETLELNLRAPFALCRAALPEMASRAWGRVVNVASTAALEGFAYTSAYVASKHALLGLTRALSVEAAQRWKDADLTLNAVCPGFVDTDIVARSVERLVRVAGVDEAAARDRLAAMNPGGRLLRPDEVADAVLALVLEQPGARHGEALVLG